MIQKLEILVTEDNAKHLADARLASEQYANINFTFARTLQEAESLVEQNKYDTVVTDVFFPAQEGDEPSSDSGLSLAKKVDAQGTPFVYNTSGNHHGRAYSQFLDLSRKIWDNYGFGSGKMIEAYPEDSNAEKDSKQWNAAINYAILLGRSQELDESVRKKIGSFISFAPGGDYGKLTETMQRVLDESISPEEMCSRKNSKPPYSWSSDALYQGWDQEKIGSEWGTEIDWDKERDCFVSFRDTKEADEKWFSETEARFKKDYVVALDFIRTILAEYRK
jgi:CheY-like chemotaxis protein